MTFPAATDTVAVLGSAQTFSVDFYGDNLFSFAPGAAASITPLDENGNPMKNAVDNKGHIIAQEGKILLTAQVAKNIVDNVINNVKEPTHILAPYLSRPLWIAAARNTSLTGFVMQTFEEGDAKGVGGLKMEYAGLKFLWGYPKDLHPPVLQFNEVASGGGAAVTASLYVLAIGEGNLRGIQIKPLEPRDIGLLQDGKTYRTHIAWDMGIVDEHIYCMARLDSWTNAAIVA